ncbi:uncharacterized protein LOC132753905 [Ruditapes philippinarum]|uniref:uncharacterized protein LOC132753905 n=1 Tax=Ruditapes philippinarum TaxID=129788 RepID=UPI00295B50B3|nr:uncharacterized protein LOC132753905 [Ruditapes philippinarum]
MDFKIVALILLGCIIASSAQGYHYGRNRPRHRPARCAQPNAIRCLRNPCSTPNGCPNYPDAVCVNDDPCNPYCVGHYYTGEQRQLSQEECHGNVDPNDGECPEGSPTLRCLVNPCSVMRCRAFPQAECRNDNACEPSCVGHFYDGDRQLSRRECRRGYRRRNRIRTL